MKIGKIISLVVGVSIGLFMLFGVDPAQDTPEVWLLVFFAAIMFGIGAYFLTNKILDSMSETSVANKIQQNIEEKKEQNELKRLVKKDLITYQEAKESFQYFSNSSLLSLYDEFCKNGIENIDRMACEEELVKRGLIESSPMREKLYLIKKKFFNE